MNNAALIKFQQFVWYFCLVYFSVVCLLLILNFSQAYFLSHLGVKIVLAATVSQLVVMAYQFRKAGRRRFMHLSYILMLVIIASSALGSYLI